MTKQLPPTELTEHLQWNPNENTPAGNVMKAILNSGLYKTRDDSLLQLSHEVFEDLNSFDFIDLETNALFAIALAKTGRRALARKVMASIDAKLQMPMGLPRSFHNSRMDDIQVGIEGKSCGLWALAQRAVYGLVPDKTLELIGNNLGVGPVLSNHTFPPNVMPYIDILSSSLWAMMRSPSEAKKTVDLIRRIKDSNFVDGLAFFEGPERKYIDTETNAYWVMALCTAGKHEDAIKTIDALHSYNNRETPIGLIRGSFTLQGVTHIHDLYVSAKENALWVLALQAAGRQEEAANLLDMLEKCPFKRSYGLFRIQQASPDKDTIRGDDNCLYTIALAGAGL